MTTAGRARAAAAKEVADSAVDVGREVLGDPLAAERREWLCTNGIGGYASGTLTGSLTRRYHGFLVAALAPPLGRTLLVAKADEVVQYAGVSLALGANRWADGTVDPQGYRYLERFRLEGTTPVWTYAFADAQLEKRLWMEPGANTTYVRYCLLRGGASVAMEATILVNYRDYHGTTRGGDWRMEVVPVPDGVRIRAYEMATPFVVLAPGAIAQPVHNWYRGFRLPREAERGLEAQEDHLSAATLRWVLRPGESMTLVLSAEPTPSTDGDLAWGRRLGHEASLLERWRGAWPDAVQAPAWVAQLVLAADQFVVRRSLPDEPDGVSVIAGYHWFGDWGRDTMIALPGLSVAAGRPEVATRVLRTFARFVDQGMLPNRFPDSGEVPEYNTVDATLWYVEALRATHEATGDDGLLKDLWATLEDIFSWHRRGTRYGIAEDFSDGLLRSGEPGVQLTWMDAKVGDRVVTPRTGKAVEVNALWFNALRAMAGFARRLGRPAAPWDRAADRVEKAFARFWSPAGGYLYDVVDSPQGDDSSLRPNQILAVSLAHSPLPVLRQRQVLDTCARDLLTSFGLRSLAPGDPAFRGQYQGDVAARDGAYHQGTVWTWLLGPFALAHLRVNGDPAAASRLLEPLRHHLGDYGVGSLGEIFDADAPFAPRGCIAQAWSVGETLRAWLEITRAMAEPRRGDNR